MTAYEKKVNKLADSVIVMGETCPVEVLELAKEIKAWTNGLTVEKVFDVLRMFMNLKKPAPLKSVARELKVPAIELYHFVQENQYSFDMMGERFHCIWNNPLENPRNPKHSEYIQEKYKNGITPCNL